MRHKPKGAKIALIVLLVIGAFFLFGFIVMSLWNSVLVPVTGVGTVSFWQAIGILVLSKILFGGFSKGHKRGFGGPPAWGSDMRAKWHNMSEEEREQVKQQWRDKCRTWGRRNFNPEPPQPEMKPNAEQ